MVYFLRLIMVSYAAVESCEDRIYDLKLISCGSSFIKPQTWFPLKGKLESPNIGFSFGN